MKNIAVENLLQARDDSQRPFAMLTMSKHGRHVAVK
jgi:hypothetical protein